VFYCSQKDRQFSRDFRGGGGGSANFSQLAVV